MSSEDQKLYYPPPPPTQSSADEQYARDLQARYDAEHSAAPQQFSQQAPYVNNNYNNTTSQYPPQPEHPQQGYPPQGVPPQYSSMQHAFQPQQDQKFEQPNPANHPSQQAHATGQYNDPPDQQVYPSQPAYPDQKSEQSYLSAPPQYASASQTHEYNPPLPPRRVSHAPSSYEADDLDYTRDPHKLVAYLVPFPKPRIANVDPSQIPDRFLIYTPPPPPLQAPAEGEKESKAHKLQRKWQEEVRSAKLSDAKVTSWKGAKGRATKGISYAMSWVKSSNLEFLNRVPDAPTDKHSDDGVHEGDTTHRTVGLTEMLLIYPATMQTTPEAIRANFVDTMLRTKSAAQKDAILATGLLPVAFAVDIAVMLVWPFGGLAEVDSVWAYASIRGAKTARSVTKRLNSSAASGDAHAEDAKAGQKLKLTFAPSQRLEVLRRYLAGECHARDAAMFPAAGGASMPTQTEVLQAIGWSSTQQQGETRNWEDEQWEMMEVKDDVKQVMGKAAREWGKWCKAFAKDPEKALKK